MKRRDFFKGILGTVAAVTISPLVLPGLLSKPKAKTGEVLVSSAKGEMAWAAAPEPANSDIGKITDSLFKYLHSHPKDLKFKYSRVYSPAVAAYYIDRSNKNSIQAKSEAMLVASRKLRTKYTPELANDLHAWGRDLHQEFEDEFNAMMVAELNEAYPSSVLYIYQLIPTGVIFSSEDFCPRRGLILRLAVANNDKEWIL